MFLLGFRRKMTAVALCKLIESAIQWFRVHHRITFATIQNSAVYLLGGRVSIFPALVPKLLILPHSKYLIYWIFEVLGSESVKQPAPLHTVPDR